MPDASEQTAFFDGDHGAGRVGEFQCDFSFEPGIPGAEHIAERSAADPFEQQQVSPSRETGSVDAGQCRMLTICRDRLWTMNVRQVGEQLKLVDEGWI